jgi:hypothetical protein
MADETKREGARAATESATCSTVQYTERFSHLPWEVVQIQYLEVPGCEGELLHETHRKNVLMRPCSDREMTVKGQVVGMMAVRSADYGDGICEKADQRRMRTIEGVAPSTCTASKEVMMLQAKYSVRVLADKGVEVKESAGRNREIKYLLVRGAVQSESVISYGTQWHMISMWTCIAHWMGKREEGGGPCYDHCWAE